MLNGKVIELDVLDREQLISLLSDVLARLIAPVTAAASVPAPANHEPAPARLMTAVEVGERLRFKPGYVYELARAGKIKSLQQGKYIRFTEAALSEYITNNGAVDTRLSNVLSITHESRRAQKDSRRNRPHTNGAGSPLGRASDDGQPMGARDRVDP